MANYFTNSYQKNPTITLVDNEQALIGANGSVFRDNGIGILATGSGNTIHVLGTVFATGNAVKMGNEFIDANNSLFIGETGYVQGSSSAYAVEIVGFHSHTDNAGMIWNRATNGGGIQVSGSSTMTETKISNSGTIDVSFYGISCTTAEKITIENSGLIKSSDNYSIRGSMTSGSITVLNTGHMQGKVLLGGGDDIFDTRSGETLGFVNTAGGNDLVYGSKAGDYFDGSDGNDRLFGFDGNDTLIGETGNDTLVGGNGDDVLFGAEDVDVIYGQAGNDYIDGGAGADNIYGGSGVDRLTGGADADRFIFAKGDTGATKATADSILDFEKIDRIELSLIDANTKASKDQDFTFIETQAFHGKAGELRYEKLANDTYIYRDVNGDRKADLVIHLDGSLAVAKEHFIL